MHEPSAVAASIDVQKLKTYNERRAALDGYLRQRVALLMEGRQLTAYLRTKAKDGDEDRTLYQRALSHLYADELTHLDLVSIARLYRQPVTHADSFWRSILTRRRKKQLGPVPEKFLGINKERDRLFAQLVGVRVPATLFSGKLNAIPTSLSAGVMLKPVHSSGGKGAFYVFSSTDIFSVSTSKPLKGWDEVRREASRQLGVNAEDVNWEVQELITENGSPSRDIKFYAFYGRIGLIVEALRHPYKQYQYFNDDFTVADCGKTHEPRFRDATLTITDKGGLCDEKMETVTCISEQIPAPFMRIDFLNTEGGLVFCEFSAAPGMSHTLSPAYDRLLGRLYNEAEIRLVNDLLAGKQFGAFHKFSNRH